MPTIPSGEIHYETHGNGTPVLLVSGLGGVGSYWAPNLAAFSARHQAIVHDHRGTGCSARSRISYSVDQMTDDLVVVMDHLKIERAHLVGHSTGGAVGQTLAAKHPERLISLTIYASWTKCDPFFRRVFEARRALLTLGGAGAYTRAASVFLYRIGGSTRISACWKSASASWFRTFRRRRSSQAASTPSSPSTALPTFPTLGCRRSSSAPRTTSSRHLISAASLRASSPTPR